MFLQEKKAVANSTAKLRLALGENLLAVLAFGSRVRGDFTEESDFDILVIVKRRNYRVIETINGILTETELTTGIPFSAVIKDADSFQKEKKFKTGFYRNIIDEGVLFYGSA